MKDMCIAECANNFNSYYGIIADWQQNEFEMTQKKSFTNRKSFTFGRTCSNLSEYRSKVGIFSCR